MDDLLDNHNIQNNIGPVIFKTLQVENESRGFLGHSYRGDFGQFLIRCTFWDNICKGVICRKELRQKLTSQELGLIFTNCLWALPSHSKPPWVRFMSVEWWAVQTQSPLPLPKSILQALDCSRPILLCSVGWAETFLCASVLTQIFKEIPLALWCLTFSWLTSPGITCIQVSVHRHSNHPSLPAPLLENHFL